jgi:DNA-binding CsgD family transcriptional regulator
VNNKGLDQLIIDKLMLKYLLSNKEKQLINLIINEKTNVEIAEIMGYSPDMIKYLIKRIFKKFKVKNRLGLVREALLLFSN